MAPASLTQLESEADAIATERLSLRSRDAYRSSSVHFLQWLCVWKPQLVQEPFREGLVLDSDGVPTASSVQAAMAVRGQQPIHFDQITAQDFMAWILSMKHPDGTYFKFASYSTHLSAFVSLFRHNDAPMPTTLKEGLSSRFGGLKKRIARQIGAGQGGIKEGKDPMPFRLYKRLSEEMLRGTTRDLVFGRTFMVLSWNLMSRAANTVSVCYNHLEWGEDALRVYFAHMKNDQGGSRPRDPRHVYANPVSPEICPIVALGIYWATYGLGPQEGKLFPGANQYDRFRKILGRFLVGPAVVEELRHRGIDAFDIGTHSIRKGAATYCSSGSTACPSDIAVHLRAGWAMGGVQDRYLRHDGAGDMHVGRTVCGLPADDASFAALPPLFAREPAAIRAAKQICFPGLPPNLSGVGAFALASLVHHLPYLRRELPRDHPLFGCSLFANDQLIEDLVAELIDPAQASITPTGIPPHVMLLSKIHHLEESQAGLADRVVAGVARVLEERAVESGVPTCDRLADRVIERLETGGYARHTAGPSPPPAPSAQHVSGPVFRFWGGGFHAFPPGVTLPTGTVDQAWLHWCCGDPAQRLPPFRHLTPADFTTRNERKRLSDFRFLMTRIDDRAKTLGLSIHQLSMADAASVLEQCRDAVSIPAVTDRGRKRRRVQLVWLTVATELRKVARQSATALT